MARDLALLGNNRVAPGGAERERGRKKTVNRQTYGVKFVTRCSVATYTRVFVRVGEYRSHTGRERQDTENERDALVITTIALVVHDTRLTSLGSILRKLTSVSVFEREPRGEQTGNSVTRFYR